MSDLENASPQPAIGSRWVAKDGRRTLVVLHVGGGAYEWCDVQNVATGRVHTVSSSGLLRKYRPAGEAQG